MGMDFLTQGSKDILLYMFRGVSLNFEAAEYILPCVLWVLFGTISRPSNC